MVIPPLESSALLYKDRAQGNWVHSGRQRGCQKGHRGGQHWLGGCGHSRPNWTLGRGWGGNTESHWQEFWLYLQYNEKLLSDFIIRMGQERLLKRCPQLPCRGWAERICCGHSEASAASGCSCCRLQRGGWVTEDRAQPDLT